MVSVNMPQVGSRYNPRQSIVDNIHLPPSLISRFDLIYLVLDKPDEASDRRLARHLLSLHYPDAQAQAQARAPSLALPGLDSAPFAWHWIVNDASIKSAVCMQPLLLFLLAPAGVAAGPGSMRICCYSRL